MLFTDFNLNPNVIAALDKMGYKEPTKIQEEVIKFALEGKNIVGQSQTGTGKTAAFVIPLLQLIDSNLRKPQAIIMAPTRELANQIREEFVKLSEGMFIRSTAVFGGSPIRAQREVLEKGPQVVVATPGRLIDLIERRYIDLKAVKFFVLDEVDRMLDMGFVDDIDHVWAQLPSIEQSMTFSATIPQEVKNLLAKYVGEGYESIKATEGVTVSKIDHSFIEVPHFEKYEMLKKYIEQHKGQKVVVFARMKHETEEIADKLYEDGYSSGCLHGDMQQRDRARALKSFQEGKCDIFVTTDVAARGLNMKDIELVVNYHVPEDPEAYIHRIGRTGRAGATGRAIMFVSNQERHFLQNIERRNKIQIKQVNLAGETIERKLTGGSSSQGGRSSHGSRRSFGGGGGSSSGGYRGDRSSGGGFGARSSGGSSYGGGSRSEGSSYGRSSGSSYAGGDRSERVPRTEHSERPSFGGESRREGGFAPRSERSERPERTESRSEGGYGFSNGSRSGNGSGSSYFGEKSDKPQNSYSRDGGAPRGGDFPKRSEGSRGGYEKRPYTPSRDSGSTPGKWPKDGE